MDDGVVQFTGRYRFLSNFWPCDIIIGPGGLRYPSVEHAYQASKTLDPDWWAKLKGAPTAGIAKRMGRRVPLIAGFDNMRLPIMRGLIRQKFAYGSKLALQLIEVKGTISEGNTWHDTFWGRDLTTGEGFDHLGIMLMEQRDDLLWLMVARNDVRKDPPQITRGGAYP